MTISIYDTTLRDGTQREGLSLSCNDKLRIARRLDALGVAFIEAGWPSSNPKDAEFFERARDEAWQSAEIVAFGSTRRADTAVEDDPNLRALLAADTRVCTVFGKSWTLHVRDVLQTTFDENLRAIEDSVAYLTEHGRRVVFDAEHFFDGYDADRIYALETLSAAVAAGAEVAVLCDTNGGRMPWEIRTAVRDVGDKLNCAIGIHCHDDTGCAVANSLAAVISGAVQVQGTINGYGERCGNANLCELIPSLEMKLGLPCLPEGATRSLFDVSHFVAEVANLTPDEHMAYVGRSAFSHKGGVHVAAMRRNSRAYSHIDPRSVGNETRVVVSELSGRGNIATKADELGMPIPGDAADVVATIKHNEARGYSYEAADASVALLVARQAADYRPPFRLIDYAANVEHRAGRGTFAEAIVKVEVGGNVVHTAAEGSGPVHALDRALRKALLPTYPELAVIQLVDYKVRIVDGNLATEATTRVLIDTTDGDTTWGTVGAGPNIIEASWQALTDAIEFGLRRIGDTAIETANRPATW